MDISSFYNISSGAIREAAEGYSASRSEKAAAEFGDFLIKL